MRNINEATEYIKVLNLGIGSHYLVDNIGSTGPRVFPSNRVYSSGVVASNFSCSLCSKPKPAVGISMV